MRRLCVFCGSKLGSDHAHRRAARRLGALLAERSLGLVYGGGDVGLMGVLADAVLAAGGEAIGVIPQALVDFEVAHRGLTELKVVRTMHERKALMAEIADAFLALPGGMGTMDEIFEALTWKQLDIHRKPCGLLNTGGYYDHLLALLDRFVEEGFLSRGNRELIIVRQDVAEMLDALAAHQPAPGVKDYDREPA
ncbi:MAG: TIGR00730 family Rossman fold protein [Planctomycetes bacterium]|nr:TIGR00730 family Rossman fold protein [Planctomycetota bacterium]